MIKINMTDKINLGLLSEMRCPECTRVFTHIWKFGDILVLLCTSNCQSVVFVPDINKSDAYIQNIVDIPRSTKQSCDKCYHVLRELAIDDNRRFMFCFDCGTLYIEDVDTGLVSIPQATNNCGGYKHL